MVLFLRQYVCIESNTFQQRYTAFSCRYYVSISDGETEQPKLDHPKPTKQKQLPRISEQCSIGLSKTVPTRNPLFHLGGPRKRKQLAYMTTSQPHQRSRPTAIRVVDKRTQVRQGSESRNRLIRPYTHSSRYKV